MRKNNLFTKIIVIAGNVLVWTPIILPFFTALFALVQLGRVIFDFLMPAELFPFVLAGLILLLWGSFRTKSRQKIIAIATVAASILLASAQTVAGTTGLAGGETEGGVPFIIAMGLLILFDLSLVVAGIGGLQLLRDLVRDFNRFHREAEPVVEDHGDDYEVIGDAGEEDDAEEEER